MIKKISIGILVFVVVIVLVMQIIGNNAGVTKESFLIKELNAQKKLIIELKKNNIVYEVDDENRVWFSPKDSEKVHSIADSVMNSVEPTHITIRYQEPKYMKLLEKKLSEKGVFYQKVIIKGAEQLRLSQDDEAIWNPIKKEVDEILIDNAREKLLMDK